MSSTKALSDKTSWGQNNNCPLHVFLHFNDTKLEKITLEKADSFDLIFMGSPEKPDVIEWFTHFLNGTHRPFPLPLLLNVGSFQKRVLSQLQKIPSGETRSYADIAAWLGQPKAARAVGTACRINPYPLVIPCHRVVKTDGGLGGFAYGLSMKRQLLDFERAQIGSLKSCS